MLRSLLVVALLGLATSTAAADDAATAPTRVAVVVQLAVNVDEGRADALGGALAEALARELVVDAIGGGDVSRRLPDAGLGEDCVTTPACLTDLGTRLDADQLLFVVIVAVGAELQIDPTWIDIATGRSVSRPKITLAADAEAGAQFAALAQRLLPDARIREPDPRIIGGGGVTITRTPRQMTTPAWIVAGVGGAALVGAVALGLSTRGAYQDCEGPAAMCSNSTLDDIETRAITADVCLGVSVAAAIGTAVLWWTSSKEEVAPTEAGDVGVEVGMAPGGATLSVGGRF